METRTAHREGPRIMSDHTTAYARTIVAGKKVCGKAEYQACKRHLDDMADKAFPYIFDVDAAEYHIMLANQLTIGEGSESRKLTTRGFQNFIIGSLFGWRKKRSHLRRFREGYIQLARQNGKSFLAGEMCNDYATFAGYQHGRIYCTATKQKQANIVWEEVAKFIRSDADLAELYKVREYDHTIRSLVTNTTIEAIGRDTKSADGFRSIMAVVDEYHAHPTDQMYKLMLDGQIAVDNALTLAITTAGFNLNAPCYEQYQFCKKVLSGNVRKDSLFIFITEMDEDDDMWDPVNWAKANPLNLWNADDTLNDEMIARMAEKAIDAREKQGRDLVNFQTKTLNRWVEYTGGGLLDLAAWRKCAADTTLEEMRGRQCYLGIDLSSGGDLTSIALIFPGDDDDVYVWSHSYMPELRLAEHIRTDDAPYGVWKDAGLLTLTSGIYGIKTDYKYIISDLSRMMNEYEIEVIGCGYDDHNAGAFLSDLEDVLSCDLTLVKQSARSLNDATKDFQLSVKAGKVSYDRRNALLTWSMVNAVISAPNSFGEIKIDKMTQTNRIDPCDAVIDAWVVYFHGHNNPAIDAEESLSIWLEVTAEGGEEES
nr:MAG TPA: Large Terminase [Caudoviricetes sp.]